MSISRRGFLAAAGAAAMRPGKSLGGAAVRLRAGPVTAQILPQGDGSTAMLGFNGMTPGPELRLRQGERLDVTFENGIGEGTAIHWHGIRIDNAMDGVPGLTQPLVGDGETFDYSFVVPDAGTYWYHSHHRSWEQVAKGLYGPLIVEEHVPPAVDRDITVVIDDWRLERSGEMAGGFGNMHDMAHAGRLGNFARALVSADRVRLGDRVRLRLINAATARVFPLELAGLDGKVVALDGRPLATPEPLAELLLAPAQRLDLIADVTGPVELVFPTPQGPYLLGEIAIEGEKDASGAGPIAALPDPARPDPGDLSALPHLTLRMQGGAMGGRHDGDDIWSFDGVSGMPEAPWADFERGAAARISLVNETAFPHGIHLHGHHFYELAADGSLGHLRDTTLVDFEETRVIVCVFDNPGKWLLHCHMLDHQASGMKTWIRVA